MIHEAIIPNPLLQSSLSTCENETQCSNVAQVLCHHCPKHLCLKHLMDHNTINVTRADELLSEIQNHKEFLSNINIEKSFENARNKLDLWKNQIFNNIESIYNFYSNEIHRLEIELNHRVNSFKNNFNLKMLSLQTQLSSLKEDIGISQQQLLPIEFNLNQLHQCLKSIKCELYFDIKNISFQNLINVYNIFSYNRTLSSLTQLQPYRTTSVDNIEKFITSKSNQSILWLDTQKQLHYIDEHFQTRQLTIPYRSSISSNQQTSRVNINIIDIKWCPFANVYLILFPQYLLSFDDKTNKFTSISVTRYNDYPFHCISCLNDTSIYISYCTSGIYIELWKYSCMNSNDIHMDECIKHWTCLTNDKTEWISHMNTNSSLQIGVLIHRGSSIYRRFELRDEHLNFLKKIQLDNDYIDAFFPFQSNYWFIKSLSNKYFIYSTDTNIYNLSTFDFPFGLQQFGVNSIVISNDKEELMICDI
ncbi:unnamed protein product [Adineta steineri]|uniref:Uncharacterized protein n=1 Tax=Adineta steineri TaxID=433720 RepID=A0A819DMC4_9BILA|nr:unnamed protein product [Adineta steineri]CAF0748585.1 unnamed protein product [Adineta steineri]CAF3489436.1 unnamed protein product [Adineta steineri]CAF3837588.1 unnamed protein product [Adineta steineri]